MAVKKRSLGKTIMASALVLFGGFLIISSSIYIYLSPKLPSIEELKDVKLQIPLKVVTKDGLVIKEFGQKKRTPVNFNDTPKHLINALLAAEDDNFFKHSGIDYQGLMRSAIQIMREGRIVGGGSTITMQVARNFFLNRKQEFTRKFNEILLALRIENELSKEEILSLYINKMFLGKTAYGFGAAAQIYYGKDLNQLSLAQIAMLAGIPKAPSTRNPIADSKKAVERRNWILGRMRKLGSISDIEFNEAISEADKAKYYGSTSDVTADYAAEMIRQQVLSEFGLSAYTDGYTAVASLDSNLQTAGVNALKKGVDQYDKRHGYRGVEIKQVPESDWEKQINSLAIVGNLEPAIITQIFKDRLILKTKTTENEILMGTSLASLRLYIDPNTSKENKESLEEIFNVGDLIRIKRDTNNNILLAQIPNIQAALVALAPEDGAIKALVGGYDFEQSRFNRVTQATRQPGSNFKPFIYATALANQYTPASIVNDSPIVFDDSELEDTWRPENDGGKFFGPTRLREALYRSRNLVSIRLLRRLGIDKTLSGLEKLGFETSNMPPDLSLALGSYALSPIDIASGYSIFANRGFQIEPYILDQVLDRNGKVIFQAKPKIAEGYETILNSKNSIANDDISNLNAGIDEKLSKLFEDLARSSSDEYSNGSNSDGYLEQDLLTTKKGQKAERVIDARTAFLIDSMLKDVIKFGTGRKAKVLGRDDIAGKTGTTNGPRDAWFSGYSPKLVATAWVGFDDNSLLGKNEYGGSSALPIWIEFMGSALKDQAEILFDQPEGISRVKIDPVSGLRVLPSSEGIFEFFKTENIPKLKSSTSILVEDKNNLLPDDIL